METCGGCPGVADLPWHPPLAPHTCVCSALWPVAHLGPASCPREKTTVPASATEPDLYPILSSQACKLNEMIFLSLK